MKYIAFKGSIRGGRWEITGRHRISLDATTERLEETTL